MPIDHIEFEGWWYDPAQHAVRDESGITVAEHVAVHNDGVVLASAYDLRRAVERMASCAHQALEDPTVWRQRCAEFITIADRALLQIVRDQIAIAPTT